MCKKLIKKSQPFGKKIQKTVGGIFLTHTVQSLMVGYILILGGSKNCTEYLSKMVLKSALRGHFGCIQLYLVCRLHVILSTVFCYFYAVCNVLFNLG